MKSIWAESLDPSAPLQEYPRMQLKRESWTNLNGIWEYQIVPKGQNTQKDDWKPVCVPFPVGSSLSMAEEIVQPDEVLWYRRTFSYKPEGGRTILNFEAVDQICSVYVNGEEVGRHAGGYTPFQIDITDKVKYQNSLMVKVVDASDTGVLAFGKQRLKTDTIWYTPVAGIWGTVWLEEYPTYYVEDIKITPDFDESRAFIELAGAFGQAKITVKAKDNSFFHQGITTDGHYVVPMQGFHPWSPEDPFLYDVEIQTEDDFVTSYFGMRKFSSGKDGNGYTRFFLNNKPLFLSGVLDQGYNVDGVYTYPSEGAMLYELQTMKSMGFNMLRKHVKVECRRWYYLCDTLGMLVMQDMPNGGSTFSCLYHQALPLFLNIRTLSDKKYARFGRSAKLSRDMYMHELDEMLDTLFNCTCIFAWVPFNEGWGQFDSARITKHIAEYDTTRLIDSASGWHDQGCGDFNSRHVYFHNFHVPKPDHRILLLSEFGGYSYAEASHCQVKKVFGYKKFSDKVDLSRAVSEVYDTDVVQNISKGLSGCIYTQLSDVETECNGILTADRKVIKIDPKKMKQINERIYRRFNK